MVRRPDAVMPFTLDLLGIDESEIVAGPMTRFVQHKGRVPDWVVRSAVKVVDDSGVVEYLNQWRREDAARRGVHPGGRPASFDDRTILTFLLILALEGSPLHVMQMPALVLRRLSQTALDLLGIDGKARAERGLYHRLHRALHRVLDLIDPFPLNAAVGGTRHRILTKVEFAAVEEARDPGEAARKQHRLNTVVACLINASIDTLPPRVQRRWGGNLNIDATFIPAFGKQGKSKWSKRHSCEPDGAWWGRSGNHYVDPDAPESGSVSHKKHKWGWDLHASAMAENFTGSSRFPRLVTAAVLDKPGFRVGENGLKLCAATKEHCKVAGSVIADRAYPPGSDEQEFQIPVRRLGYGIVCDYRGDQLGQKAGSQGAPMAEGSLYCPAIPAPYLNVHIDHRDGSISDDAFEARLKERSKYRVQVKEVNRSNGSVRMTCPAAGQNPTVACPLKPRKDATGLTQIETGNLPVEPGPICTQGSVTLTADDAAKYRQELEYKSEAWKRAYGIRSNIENVNSQLKDGAFLALEDPRRRRVRGYTAQFVFCAVTFVAFNVNAIRRFFVANPGDADPARANQQNRRAMRPKSVSPQPADADFKSAKDPPTV